MDFSSLKGRKVLLTGHTGFKGAWLSTWLHMLGADVAGMALDPRHDNGVFQLSGIGRKLRDYRADIRDQDAVTRIFFRERPEVVFHLAAQPLVLDSYRQPAETFAVNTLGTVHVLEAIRRTPSVRAAVMVTTDKCYENREWLYGYRESDALGGHDPYSASKGAAELAIAAYRRSFFREAGAAAVASARAGNVIGGGDRAAGRLVPDIIRALDRDGVLELRNPLAVRPWQHVLEPLSGYLLLACRLLDDPVAFAEAWNFGPFPANALPVRDLADAFLHHYGKGQWRDSSNPAQAHETCYLTLDINKAIRRLGWTPVLDFPETVRLTADWYTRCGQEPAAGLCEEQIHTYQELWRRRHGHPAARNPVAGATHLFRSE